MVNQRTRRTEVRGFTRTNGTRIASHPTTIHTGDRRFQVYWRYKEVVLPGGTRHKQRRARDLHWKLHDTYSTNDQAERSRRSLMREGKHAVTINVGARESLPDPAAFEKMLKRSDKDRTMWRKR